MFQSLEGFSQGREATEAHTPYPHGCLLRDIRAFFQLFLGVGSAHWGGVYERKNPEKLADLDDLLAKYADKLEQALLVSEWRR